ncbi:hypothetical protein B2J93_7144 [Marssonina coronariae]|uniref:Uncharacterized protein n=1 Tax=Diplocarpon coronariae TaxID=2795749 RepID=A0A218Z4R4_9HELO|nr:hypothetical protein B2J93_7144 [Marssonina coronariae]
MAAAAIVEAEGTGAAAAIIRANGSKPKGLRANRNGTLGY